jgi:multiple sugar transport system permease protein
MTAQQLGVPDATERVRISRRSRPRLGRLRWWQQGLLQVVAMVVMLVCVVPIALIIIASFHHVRTFSDLSFNLNGWTLRAYRDLLALGTVPQWVANTLFVCIVSTALVLVVDMLAAYAFAKIDFRGRTGLFLVLLSTMMLPFSVTLVPTYLLANSLGLIDTYAGLILPGLSGPIGVFLLRQFMRAIPDEILEAARIDGARHPTIFLRIVAPLCFQPMAILAILTFVANWNGFIWPLLVIQSDSLKTLTVGLATTNTEFVDSISSLTAATVISVVPMALLFFAFQRYFLSGLTTGAMKG